MVDPKPFLTWPGRKTRLLPELLKHAPSEYGSYHEPFLGSGALFFALKPKRAYLTDVNDALITAFIGVKHGADEVGHVLNDMPFGKEHYYKIRDSLHEGKNVFEKAAKFIYVNRYCFNGLWRENRQGKMNVPFGSATKPVKFDVENLKRCSEALQGTSLATGMAKYALLCCNPGDFVYCDPPYVPASETASFVSYNKDGFGITQQSELKCALLNLKLSGVHVLASNSDTVTTRELYGNDFDIVPISVRRSISCKSTTRGYVKELVIT